MPWDEQRRARFALEIAKFVASTGFTIVRDGRARDEGECVELGLVDDQKPRAATAETSALGANRRAGDVVGAKLHPMLSVAQDAAAAYKGRCADSASRKGPTRDGGA